MKGPQLSIRDILLLITGVLTLIIVLLAAKEMYGNWQRLSDIRSLRSASALSDQLFDATEKLSVERDVALSMLNAPDDQAAADLQPRLKESRHNSDEALQAGMMALDAYDFPELSGLQEKIRAHLSAVRALRSEVDAATKEPTNRHRREVTARWSNEVTALILETQNLWIAFVRHFTRIDPIVTEQLWYKHFLRTITDYSGRERSLIGQLIVDNADPTPEQVAQLLRGQGVTEEGWQMARVLAEQSGLYAGIAPYYSDAKSHYSTMHDMIQDMFYVPGARHGETYPIGIDLWFELSTQASDSLSALRDASIKQTQKYAQGLIDGAEREIVIQAAVFLLALLLCAYSFRVIARRVVGPINAIIDALMGTTRGESVEFALPANQGDEIGKLAEVLRVFQQNLEHVKKTAAELDRSESHLRTVVDHARDGLVTMDSTGTIKSFNLACEQIFGYAAGEVIGQNMTTIMPDFNPGTYDIAYISGLEANGRRKDGSTFPIEVSVSAFASDGKRHFSGIIRDITARKEAELELAKYTHALERSNKELDDFAYIASHDLKEPLRGIHNHSRFLLEDNSEKLDEGSVGRLNRLVFLSQRMERLVNDLLYFSRLGRQELAVQATDLNTVVADIESTLEHFLEERGARITVAEHLPIITCDKTRVTELFRNLITNAVKYNDKIERKVEIGFLLSKSTLNGNIRRKVFFVKDNGLGIQPEFHQEVFRIFKRLQASKEPEDGTGVGLTFVKKIVERHGGEIWLESEPGKGTTFYFTLETSRHEQGNEPKAA